MTSRTSLDICFGWFWGRFSGSFAGPLVNFSPYGSLHRSTGTSCVAFYVLPSTASSTNTRWVGSWTDCRRICRWLTSISLWRPPAPLRFYTKPWFPWCMCTACCQWQLPFWRSPSITSFGPFACDTGTPQCHWDTVCPVRDRMSIAWFQMWWTTMLWSVHIGIRSVSLWRCVMP